LAITVSALRKIWPEMPSELIKESRAAGFSTTEPASKSIPFFAPELSDEKMVDRDEIDELVNKLIGEKNSALVFLPGVGKTELAKTIARHPKLRSHFDGILWADVGKDGDRLPVLKEWAKALDIPEETTSQLATLEAWTAEISKAIGTRRMLLILDDVWRMKAGEEFKNLGTNCRYLVTTRDQGIAALLTDSVTILDPLSAEKSMELLQKVAPEAMQKADEDPALKQALQQIVINLGGLPLALRQVGNYLRSEYGANRTGRLKEAIFTIESQGALFGKDPSVQDITKGMRAVLDLHYRSLKNIAKRGFVSLSVFRPNPHTFTKTMAQQICDISWNTLKYLDNAGLISSPEADSEYSMHRVLSDYGYSKLTEEDRKNLHAKAVAYYDAEIQKIAGAEALSYASWYRYENAAWQQLQQAKLYHLAHAAGHWAVGQALIRIYFDAFWWWGYYQPFAFCDALVKDWQQRLESPEIEQILKELAEFRQYYPAGYEKRDKPGWDKVRDTLLALRKHAALDGAVDSLNPEQRHVRGLMDFFLAEAFAYGDADDSALALETYESARTAFETLGDDWNNSWISFYLADLLAESGDHARALDYCANSIKLAENMPLRKRDPEILGNVYRVKGDIAFAKLDYAEATKHYRSAGFYAYCFQGVPNPPDTYTLEFYEEITGKIACKVAELMATEPSAGRNMLASLKNYWEPYWKQAGSAQAHDQPDSAQDIAAYVFPVPPTEEQAKTKDKAYQKQVGNIIDVLDRARFQ